MILPKAQMSEAAAPDRGHFDDIQMEQSRPARGREKIIILKGRRAYKPSLNMFLRFLEKRKTRNDVLRPKPGVYG